MSTNNVASAQAEARQAWHHALKLRRLLEKQIQKLKANSTSGTDIAQFDAIDESLTQLRLACVSTIFLDFEYAVSETAEDVLWTLHISINDQYRRILNKLRQESRVVEKRKVETKYGHFLRIAEKFYKAYIQRLSARYELPDLKRVAYGIQAEEMDPKDIISPVPADLASKVLASCHATLIRLGDLARYRVQAKHKKSFDTALVYYSIAHDLIPDSGFAFHQMSVINREEGNHLDVVYHLYRALAVKDPHPMAKTNLEATFREVQKQNPTRGKQSPSAYDALMTWFARLHARFYKGESVSPQHNEVEREVIHRLTTAAKDVNAGLMLLKMSLVNMSACWIASTNYNDSKTETASRFHQYALHFSARFLLKLCEVIESDIKHSLDHQQSESKNENETNGMPSAVTTLLPVLRIYCIWIAARRSEIFGSPNTPGNVVPPMARSLARVLTFLCAEIQKLSDAPASCPYLLQEDIETRGLRSFSNDQVPAPCRSYCTEDGKLKPHRDPKTEPLDASHEATARILDLLRSAYFLAEDSAVPLTCDVVDGQVMFRYQQDRVPNDIQGNAGDNQVQEKPAAKGPGVPQADDNGIVSPTFPSDRRNGQGTIFEQSPEKSSHQPDDRNLATMDDADQTVVDMLSPFLDCPTPKSEQGAQSPDEPSYGMHSTTANQLAQELLSTFKPEKEEQVPYYESLTPGKFGSSTWNHFFTSTPPQPQTSRPARQGPPLSGHRGSNHSSRGSISTGEALAESFATPGRRAMGNLQPGSNMGSPGASPAEGLGSYGNQRLQAFANSSGPRKSSFSNWPANRTFNSMGQSSNPWAQQAPVGAPASSVASAFSHPSSVYQGTPGNTINRDQAAYGNAGDTRWQNGTAQEGGPSGSRHFQMDDTASSYDAAIFQAALQENK